MDVPRSTASPTAALPPASEPPLAEKAEIRAGRSAADPDSEATDALVPQGRYVFERNCVVCHGRWGDGNGEMATGMRPRPRKLSSGIFKFRSTPAGFLPTDSDLTRTIRRGIANSSMPVFGHLASRDVEAVIAYVKSLSSRWRHSANYADPVPLPPEPAWLFQPDAAASHVAAGARLFEANCVACHGVSGDGHGPAAAALEDQWGEPCPPADLRQPSAKSGPELRDLYRALSTGLDGTPMPSFREGLTEAERWDLVAFLARLRQPKAADRSEPGAVPEENPPVEGP